MNVMGDGLLQQESLRLSVFSGDRNELLVELCIDGETDLDRRLVSHSKLPQLRLAPTEQSEQNGTRARFMPKTCQNAGAARSLRLIVP